MNLNIIDELHLPGAMFRPISFIPWTSKYKGVNCGGIQVHINNRSAFRPVLTGVAIISTILKLYGEHFHFSKPASDGRHFFDLLAGTPELREAIEDGLSPIEIAESWEAGVDSFRQTVEGYLLY